MKFRLTFCVRFKYFYVPGYFSGITGQNEAFSGYCQTRIAP